ncbi:MAG TPA: hypothetical protein VM791_19185, partial [Vicinamibacterales bacterium]|nr:hypothetical protein [Vicinamibacterales bacterium]
MVSSNAPAQRSRFRTANYKIGPAIALLAICSIAVHAQTPAPWVPKVRAWIEGHQPSVITELLDLLSIPNVAADRVNVRRNAEHLRALFAKRGFGAELLETAGNPLVYAELKVPGAVRT